MRQIQVLHQHEIFNLIIRERKLSVLSRVQPVRRVDFHHLLTLNALEGGKVGREEGGCSEESLPGDVASRSRTGDGFARATLEVEETEGAIEPGREGGVQLLKKCPNKRPTNFAQLDS